MSEEPRSLEGWKRYFRDHIEEARCAVMPDDERDELIEFVKEAAELIFFAPYEPPPEIPPAPQPWWDR
jgi:hypothetical protein